jgi:hypothetical protein
MILLFLYTRLQFKGTHAELLTTFIKQQINDYKHQARDIENLIISKSKKLEIYAEQEAQER